MPTPEWFQQNPRIAAYLSPELHQRFTEWMSERSIPSTSQAIATILKEYFGVVEIDSQSQIKEIVSSVAEEKLQPLSDLISQLENRVAELEGRSPKVKRVQLSMFEE